MMTRMPKAAFLSLFTIACIVAAPHLVGALPFNTDMFESEKLVPGNTARTPVPGTVPIGAVIPPIDTKEKALALKNPYAGDERSILLGKRLFEVNCSACHGWFNENGEARPAAIATKMLMAGPDLSQDFYEGKDDGLYYGTIHFGGYVFMPPVGWKLSSDETWHIVSYLRHIQSKK